VVKDGDKTYTKADLRRIKANAKKILRKDAPAREAWINERQASDQQAIQTFDFLSDGESEDYKVFMQVKQSPLYKPLVDHLPNSNFALGLMVEGLKAVKAKQANAGQPKKLKKPTALSQVQKQVQVNQEPREVNRRKLYRQLMPSSRNRVT